MNLNLKRTLIDLFIVQNTGDKTKNIYCLIF